MARPANTHDNSTVRTYLIDAIQLDDELHYGLSGWLDDVLTGAGRLNGSLSSNTLPISKGVILNLLLSHDTITAETVKASLSRRRIALEDAMISDRYARHVASVTVAASKSIQYHKERKQRSYTV